MLPLKIFAIHNVGILCVPQKCVDLFPLPNTFGKPKVSLDYTGTDATMALISGLCTVSMKTCSCVVMWWWYSFCKNMMGASCFCSLYCWYVSNQSYDGLICIHCNIRYYHINLWFAKRWPVTTWQGPGFVLFWKWSPSETQEGFQALKSFDGCKGKQHSR